jgi:hypothetical protein
MADVDLRGLTVKGAVQAPVPDWAETLAWADGLPLLWAGRTGNTKVLFVGVPLLPSGSRLPLVASFPVLMRSALQWMLPGPEALRPGEPVKGWTSRRVGFVAPPTGDRKHAFSVLSADESDLRRGDGARGETFAARRPLTGMLVALAVVLLGVEWALFHRRLTE